MRIFNNKKNALIALILTLTIAATLLTLPVANAHDPAWTCPTYAYVAASPPTVGVGEYTLIVMWTNVHPMTASGLGGDRWRGFTVDITKPDGSKEQLGPFTSDQIGSAWTRYTPDQVGDYTIVFSWPGQTLTLGTGTPSLRMVEYVGDYFEPSTSEPFILHVQQDPIEEWVEPPLPEYWNRPLNTANRGWAQLASNYLRGSWLRYQWFQEEGQGPNTPHILWAKELLSGGIGDARFGAVKMDDVDYEYYMPAPIVMNGKIYYNALTYPDYGYTCLDLRTGEQLWHKNGTDNGLGNPTVMIGRNGPIQYPSFPQLTFGQLYHWHSQNGQGINPHLWMEQTGTPQTETSGGRMWYMLDANTGNWVMSLKNVPSGTDVTDQDGNILRYTYNPDTGNFLCWNVSQSIGPAGPTGTGQQQWEPRTGSVLDAVYDDSWTKLGGAGNIGEFQWFEDDILPRSGYTMNVTGPTGLPGSVRVLQDENYVPKMMLLTDFPGVPGRPLPSQQQIFRVAAVRITEGGPWSPFPEKTTTQNTNLGYGVTLLYNKTVPYPITTGNLTFSLGVASFEDDVFTLYCKEKMTSYGYSITTGEMLWGPTDPMSAFDYYSKGGYTSTPHYYAYGKLYACSYGGTLYCWDIKTGELLWTYTAPGIGHEVPYGNYPLNMGAIADGKLFVVSHEHSPTQPMWRGSMLRAINATDGTEIWKILHFAAHTSSNDVPVSVADGCIISGNHYDNRLYVYGKGPSATTVSAPDTVQPLGTPVLVKGTVTDTSPGAQEIAQKSGSAVAAVADEDQQAWMEYLYMQQACPTTGKGVEVTLDTIDPNGNWIHIGRVTSDMSGMFKNMWTPDIEGEYTIMATFEGSESYASSYAETAIGVGPAPSPAQPIEPEPTEPAEAPFITTEIAILIAVVVVAAIGIVAYWTLRKRK